MSAAATTGSSNDKWVIVVHTYSLCVSVSWCGIAWRGVAWRGVGGARHRGMVLDQNGDALITVD